MNNTIKDSTNKNIDLGVDLMAKKIMEILEPISAKRCCSSIGGHTNEKNNIRCKNFFRQR